MRDESRECSEELLSGLLDDELDVVEKRQAAMHAATCPHCAQALGQLFAMRAAVSIPMPRKVTVPRTLWRGVRERLDRVDGLVRATNLSPQRQRPLVSPTLIAVCVTVLALAFGAKAVLLPTRPMPYELARLHLQASLGPSDPGLTQTVNYEVGERWEEMSSNLVNVNGVGVLQTIYSVSGLPVSVFRLPPNSVDVSHMSPVRVNNQMLYLAGSPGSSVVAVQRDCGWDIVVARSPVEETITLAMSCPRPHAPLSPY